jgi:ABC-type uncharacterized transport system YnjBCD ATPase subunit
MHIRCKYLVSLLRRSIRTEQKWIMYDEIFVIFFCLLRDVVRQLVFVRLTAGLGGIVSSCVVCEHVADRLLGQRGVVGLARAD